jgi:rod shape-determining protein MreC
VKALFLRQTGAGYLLTGLLIASAALMWVETTQPWLRGVRETTGTFLSPIYFVAEIPYQFSNWAAQTFSTREQLQTQNRQLNRRVLELSQVSQQFLALREENRRLRALLGSKARLAGDVLVAEIVGVVPSPSKQQIIIDKGTAAGIEVGLAVIDEYGMVGQITAASGFSSQVLLVTDLAHALPVQVVRNNLRIIAAGTGQLDLLRLEHVSDSADIREGDVLVSSGLAGRFPTGYPVGVVSEVSRGTGAEFALVNARPSAQLDRSRHVLVLFNISAEDAEAQERFALDALDVTPIDIEVAP